MRGHGVGAEDRGADGDLIAELTRFLTEQRADEAVEARTRERWLLQQAEEEGTVAGLLLDLAERVGPVLMSGVSGRRHRGVLRGVAVDFCVLATERSSDVLVAFRALSSVRAQGSRDALTADRPVPLGTDLATALVGLAGDRPRVLVVTVTGEGLAGELRAVGQDLLTLRLDGPDRAVAYVPVASVAELSLSR